VIKIKPEHEFIRYLRFERHLQACDQVSNYFNIADVIALDKRKKLVLEFEFKKSSHDLKVKELKKRKYHSISTKWPHKFYFVVPEKLWKKEKRHLKKVNKERGIGTIIYHKLNGKFAFLVVENSKLKNVVFQDYNIVQKNLMVRCTSAYAKLLVDYHNLKG